MKGLQIDFIGPFAVEVPVDMGWGIATLHADRTVTRQCKGCGVSVRTPVNLQTGKVTPVAFEHGAGCSVIARLLPDKPY